jgi:hypothetical protein
MTGNQLIGFIRSKLREPKAQNWEEEDLLYALNEAKDYLQAWVTNFEGEYFYTSCTITTTIGLQYYTLPDGTLYDGAPKCNGTIDFIQQSGYRPIVCGGDFRRFHQNPKSGSVISDIDIKHKSLWIDILPASEFPFTIYYYYLLPDIEATDVEIDWIPGCDHAIAWFAILNSKIRVQDDTAEVEKKCRMWQAMIQSKLGSRIHGGPRQIPMANDLTDYEYDGMDDSM